MGRCQRTCLASLVVVTEGEHWLRRCWLLAIWLELLLEDLKAGHDGRISAQTARRREKRDEWWGDWGGKRQLGTLKHPRLQEMVLSAKNECLGASSGQLCHQMHLISGGWAKNHSSILKSWDSTYRVVFSHRDDNRAMYIQ